MSFEVRDDVKGAVEAGAPVVALESTLISHGLPHPDNIEEQDKQDSANLYKALTEEVIPSFYNRDANGIPRQWIQKIRRAMATLVVQFSTDRMVREYTEKYYLTK